MNNDLADETQIIVRARHPWRRHPLSQDAGVGQQPTCVRLHTTCSKVDGAAMRRRMATSGRSFHYYIDGHGSICQWLELEHAAKPGAASFALPFAELDRERYASVSAHRRRSTTESDLASVDILISNRGPLAPGEIIDVERTGGSVIKCRHDNPSIKRNNWHAFTDIQVDAVTRLVVGLSKALPSLAMITGVSDVANAYVAGRGRPRGDASNEVGPGPAFPWGRLPLAQCGLTRVRYDYGAACWHMVPPPPNAGIKP